MLKNSVLCGDKVKCLQPTCGFIYNNISQLLSHIREHMDEGDSMQCPFSSCTRLYCNSNSFKCHVHREHRVSETIERITSDSAFAQAHLDQADNNASNEDQQLQVNSGSNCAGDIASSAEGYTRALAIFYIKLQVVYFIPSSVTELIIKELQTLTQYANRNICQQLISKFEDQISPELQKCILSELSCIDLFQATRSGCLRSEYLRKEWIKKNTRFVAPIALTLGNLTNKRGKMKRFYYVPIKDSLLSLLSDQSVIEEYRHSLNATPSINELRDVIDGSVYKSNALFTMHPDSLKLVLYSDAFEVANPLGSAKCKHKIYAVYYSLANIRPHNRSSTDQMQLILLCYDKDKDFESCGQEIIFSQLIQDLKQLEDNGICVPLLDNKVIKGSVIAIAGDNLGSHALGGFVRNFSVSEYFCRYCTLSKQEFHGDKTLCIGKVRTPENYAECAQEAVHTPPVKGITCESQFNQLKYFNVIKGLPPCLAHDVFEGVLAYDVKLCLNHFIKTKKWFTLSYLNNVIVQFAYKDYDASSVPCTVSATNDKLQGSAAQNWTFLRLMPLIIGEKILDFDDSAWRLICLLRELVELICAPKISTHNIALLDSLIEEYLELRKDTFPSVRLRPKHHYLRHYAMLTVWFGPLIRVWTLRFESKHAFFKKVVRSMHNFINVCFSLSEQHQLLQAVINSTRMFTSDLIFENGLCFVSSLYNESIQNAVNEYDFKPENTTVCADITLRGTVYKNGQYLVIARDISELLLGEIIIILIQHRSKVYFIVHELRCIYLHSVHLFEGTKTSNCCTRCISEFSLHDYCPLPAYGKAQGTLKFVLKHFV